MSRIILNVRNEQKAQRLLALLGDLDYVEAEIESSEKIWKGLLPVFDNPVVLPEFKMYTREELNVR